MKRPIFIIIFCLIQAMNISVYPSERTVSDAPLDALPAIYIEKIDSSDIDVVTSDVYEDEDVISEIKKDIAGKTRKIFKEKLEDVAFVVKKRPKTGMILNIRLIGNYTESGFLGKILDNNARTVTLSMELTMTDAETGDLVLSAKDSRSEIVTIENKLFDRSTEDKQLNAWYRMISYWAATMAKQMRSGEHR